MAVMYELYGGKNAPKDPTAMAYMQSNIDVWNAFNADPNATDATAFAQNHFNTFGRNEGRIFGNPNTVSGNAGKDALQLFNPDAYPESRAGLDQDYLDQIMSSIMPLFKSSLTDFTGNVDSLVNQGLMLSKQGSTDMLSEVLQNELNKLNTKGILDSSITKDVLGNATGEVLKNYSNQVLQAGMEGAKLKLGLPDMLGQLMGNLGKTSTSSDKSVPYRTLAALLGGSI